MVRYRKHFGITFLLLAGLGCAFNVSADYSQHPKAQEFISRIAAKHSLDPAEIKDILAQAEKQQAILDAISRPAEKVLTWGEYRKIFLGRPRVEQGVEFWQKHRDTLKKVSEKYGVDEEIIVAIIGVETRYGKHKGSYRVIDALTTLGFDYPPRGDFFSGELEHFLLLADEQNQNPVELVGSYAGAMGYGQFIPSSYRAYAVDYDGDKVADIWNNPDDAIASVANYFMKHGWQAGQRVALRARIENNYDKASLNNRQKPSLTISELGKKGFTPVDANIAGTELAIPLMYEGEHGAEFWLGFDNFYVITRYNKSLLYAMAVFQLSQEIKSQYVSQLDNESKSTG